MTLADLQALVDDLVRDKDQVISSMARDTAIAAALARYSADAPRSLVEDVVSAGGHVLPLPSEWAADSELRSLEHPIGRHPPSLIALTGAMLYQAPDGPELRLVVTLLDGDQVRVTFTAPHVVDVDGTTIPERHRRPVACLAAADLCGQLANYYATEGAPTIGADTVDHQSKTERFNRRQRDLRAEYVAAVGSAPSDRAKPASVDVALPSRDSLGGRRIFHPPKGWRRA